MVVIGGNVTCQNCDFCHNAFTYRTKFENEIYTIEQPISCDIVKVDIFHLLFHVNLMTSVKYDSGMSACVLLLPVTVLNQLTFIKLHFVNTCTWNLGWAYANARDHQKYHVTCQWGLFLLPDYNRTYLQWLQMRKLST